MAITASIALSPSTLGYNMQGKAVVTVSNSGGADVTITALEPIIQRTSSTAPTINSNSQASTIPQGFGQVFTVPASGSVDVPFNYVVFSPQVTTSSSSLAVPGVQHKVGCIVSTSDGSQTSPTPATLTITPLSFSPNED